MRRRRRPRPAASADAGRHRVATSSVRDAPLGFRPRSDRPTATRGAQPVSRRDDLRQVGDRADAGLRRAHGGHGVHRAVRRQPGRRRRPLLGGHGEADVDVQGRVALDHHVPPGLAQVPGRFDVSRQVPVGTERQQGPPVTDAASPSSAARDRSRFDVPGGDLHGWRAAATWPVASTSSSGSDRASATSPSEPAKDAPPCASTPRGSKAPGRGRSP